MESILCKKELGYKAPMCRIKLIMTRLALLIFGLLLVTPILAKDDTQLAPHAASSLTFVFDTTGSMVDDLNQVIHGASEIINKVSSRTIKEYILVPFRDPYVSKISKTPDSYEFKNYLKRLKVNEGADCPEPSIKAIIDALKASLPRSFIYVFTDASAKDYERTNEALEIIQKKQSQVVFIMTGDCGDVNGPSYTAYEKIAALSSGQIFKLEKNQVNQILKFVGESVGSRKVNLYQKDHNEPDNTFSKLRTSFVVPIDPLLQTITVRVSGGNPKIEIHAGSKRNAYRKFIQNKQTLGNDYRSISVNNIKSVTITDLQNNNYNSQYKRDRHYFFIKVTANGKYSIRVNGNSPLNFDTGFSKEENTKMENTISIPINGHNSYMYIKVTKGLDKGNTYTEFYTMGAEKIGHAKTLAPLSGKLYRSQLEIMSPDNPFVVMLKGRVQGREFQRIAKSMIKPSDIYAPRVTFPPIHYKYYGQDLKIVCDVMSLIETSVEIVEMRTQKRLNALTLKSSGRLEGIVNSEYANGTKFVCTANSTKYKTEEFTKIIFKERPPTILTFENKSSVLGAEIRMNCLVEGNNIPYEVQWFHNGQELFGQKRGNDHSLLISNIRQEDFGEYICMATNTGGSREKSASLIKKYKPLVELVKIIEFLNGQPFSGKCIVKANPKAQVEWTFKNQPLSLPRHNVSDDGRTFTVISSSPSDQGEYKCTARNEVGASEAITTAKMIEKAKITFITKPDIYETGSQVVLKCLATGEPKPAIVWYKAGSKIFASPYVRFENNGEMMIFDNIASYDEDDYQCEATNYYQVTGQPIHTSTNTTNIQMGSGPRKNMGEYSDTYRRIGSYNKIGCPYNVDPNVKPKLTVTWYMNNELIRNNTNGIIITEDSELEFNEIRKAHENTYTCYVENKFGKVESKLLLEISGLVKPFFLNVQKNVSPPEFTNYYMTCDIPKSVYPKPSISWTYLDQDIVFGDTYQKDFENPSSIIINNVSQSLDGKYQCSITNEGGSANQVIKVKVKTLPSGDESDLIVTVNRGDNATLPCKFTASPGVQYDWFFDAALIASYSPVSSSSSNQLINGNYELVGAKMSNNGTFICRAHNDMGQKQRRVTLIVNDTPFITTETTSYNTITDYDSTTTMYCEATGTPKPTIKWYTRKITRGIAVQSEIVSDINGKYFIDPVNNFLKIVNNSISDISEYVCIARNLVGEDSLLVKHNIQETPKFVNNIEEETTVLYGSRYQLDCSHTGYPMPDITWLFENEVIPTNNSAYKFENDVLMVDSVLMEHDGRFKCKVNNSASTIQRYQDVTVGRVPYITTTLREESTKENIQKKLFCEGSGTPTPLVSWLKNGLPLSPEETYNIISDGKGTLEIRSPSSEHQDTYTCVFTNEHGNATHDIFLNVYDIPTINGDISGIYESSNKPNMSYVENNSRHSIACIAISNPTSTITWYREGILLTRKDFIDSNVMRLSPDNSTITFNGISYAQVDSYHCQAENKAGKSTYHFSVNIIQKPQIDGNQINPDTNIDRGDSLTMTCYIYGRPQPSYSWYFKGEEVKMGQGDFMLSDDSKSLTISAATEDLHEGDWKCVGSNNGGSAEIVFPVRIFEPAQIVNSHFKEALIHFNHTLEIDCTATGNPTPQITWYKDGAPMDMLNQSRAYFSPDFSKMFIHQIVKLDIGIYKCIAKNQKIERMDLFSNRMRVITHKDSKITNANIIVEPYIKREQMKDNVVVLIENSVTLHCPYGGIPRPQINWFYKGKKLTNPHSTRVILSDRGTKLSLTRLKEDQDGVYKCEVKNNYGTDSQNIQVTINKPPKIMRFSTLEFAEHFHNYTLSCNATGIPKPTIEWYIGDMKITEYMRSTRDYFISELDTQDKNTIKSQLIINLIRSRETATFTCVATNNAGTDLLKYRVKTFAKINVKSFNAMEHSQYKSKHYESDIGNTLTLSCVVEGYPVEKIVIKKNNDVIHIANPYVSRDNRLKFNSNNGKKNTIYTLLLDHIEVADSAVYSCEASNFQGKSDPKQLRIKVIVPAYIKNHVNSLKNITAISGSRVALRCQSYGIPEPVNTWYHNNVEMVNGEINNVYFNGNKLIINPIKPMHEGKYTCSTRNKGGNDTTYFYLKVNSPPNIIVDNLVKRLTTNIGTDVSFMCSTTAKHILKISWLKNGKEFDDRSFNNVHFNQNRSQVYFKRVTKSDTAIYTCMVSNVAGDISINYSLDVIEPVTITSQSRNFTYTAKQTAYLNCSMRGEPKPYVYWDKNGQLDNNADFDDRMRYMDQGQLLVIRNVRVSDAGRYRCVGENVGATQTQFQYLIVNVPPKIDGDIYEFVSILKDQVGQLTCNISEGLPAPKISWTFNRGPLHLQSHILTKGNQSLQIRRSTDQDQGNFTCLAENNAGRVRKHIIVSILTPPKIDHNMNPSLSIKERDTTKLSCKASGSSKLKVKWMAPNNKQIPHSNHDYVMTQDSPDIRAKSNTFYLEIPIVTEELIGNYTCIVSNHVGSDNITYSINILVAPIIDPKLTKEFYPIIGHFPKFRCTILKANPDAEITWYKVKSYNKQEMALNSEVWNWSGENLKYAKKGGITNDHKGIYRCKAKNEYGSDSYTFNITIYQPPHFKTSLELVKALENSDNVTLICPPRKGIPKPRITWKKEGVTILENNDTLVIYNPSVKDKGSYLCIATNDAGESSVNMKLMIYERLKMKSMPNLWSIIKGENSELDCSVKRASKQDLVYVWKMNNGDLENEPSFSAQGSKLKLSVASVSDDGKVFHCIAKNKMSVVQSRNVTLRVYDAPRIIGGNANEYRYNKLEQDIRFDCLVAPNIQPKPKLTWYFTDLNLKRELALNDKKYYSNFDFNGTYLLRETRRMESGTYTCEYNSTIQGKKFSVKKDFILSHLQMPRFVDGTRDSVIEVKSGEVVYMPCAVVAEDAKFTDVRYYAMDDDKKNYSLVKSYRGMSMDYTTGPGVTVMRLSDVDSLHSRIYKCVASNVNGKIEKLFDVRVTDRGGRDMPNLIKNGPVHLEYKIGDTAILDCSTNEVAVKKIWYNHKRYGMNPIVSKDYNLINNKDNLELIDLQKIDEGEYICLAKNKFGSRVKKFIIKILKVK